MWLFGSPPGLGRFKTVFSVTAVQLIAIIPGGFKAVKISLSQLDFSNQGYLGFSKRRNMVLFRLLTNLLHFHGYFLLFACTSKIVNRKSILFRDRHPLEGFDIKKKAAGKTPYHNFNTKKHQMQQLSSNSKNMLWFY
jgi:hypothetical protein